MKILYLIRHAESLANSGGKSLPDKEIPLSDTGQQQAEQLINRLPQSHNIFTSEFLRTQLTAKPYLQHYGCNAEKLALLNEFSYLPLDWITGMTAEQRRPISSAYWNRANPLEKCGENTDSFAEFNQRISSFIHQAKTLPDNSLCFTHGIWISMLVWRLLGFQGDSSDDMRKFHDFSAKLPMPNTSIWILQLDPQENWRIHSSAL